MQTSAPPMRDKKPIVSPSWSSALPNGDDFPVALASTPSRQSRTERVSNMMPATMNALVVPMAMMKPAPTLRAVWTMVMWLGVSGVLASHFTTKLQMG